MDFTDDVDQVGLPESLSFNSARKAEEKKKPPQISFVSIPHGRRRFKREEGAQKKDMEKEEGEATETTAHDLSNV